jgi:HSP20 family molecular chaperone IbpA
VPDGTSVDDVKADYGDGLLEVGVPCPAEKDLETKKVPVTRS